MEKYDVPSWESMVVRYDYDEFSIRLWLRNHDVVEYTVDDVGESVINEMKRLADLGRGLTDYMAKSRVISSVVPRRWQEWLG